MQVSRSLARSLFVLPGLLFLAGPASAVVIDWVLVGDPGNPPNDLGAAYSGCAVPWEDCGSVPYEYYVSTYEVTNSQYAEFLNARERAGGRGLYAPQMASDADGGILRSGTPGTYTYAVKPGFGDKPVNFVSLYDAMRFANWLHNGQGNGDTESGAYTLLGGTPRPQNWLTVARNPEAIDFVPGLNEWFKAAYYDPATGGYFLYPTATDTQPVCSAPTATPNRANCGWDVVGSVTEVGSYPGSPGPYGTFDQGGNVVEWIEEYRTNPAWADARVMPRGGSWTYGPELLSWEYDTDSPADYESDFFGFRVASLVPEPSAGGLGIAALATLVALRRR